MAREHPSLLVILGPTASGKTDLSIVLAQQLDGEILSADARMVYIGMDIGTAKPMQRHRPEVASGDRRAPSDARHAGTTIRPRDASLVIQRIPHFLIDILTPDTSYSAADFRDDALRIISQIHGRRHLPIIVGGTGHYVRTLTEGLPLANVPPDPTFRAWAGQQSHDALVAELEKHLPDAATRIEVQNSRRVIRALEILRGGGKLASVLPLHEPPLDILKLALIPDRKDLRRQIEARVDEQLRAGLVEEVRKLVAIYGQDAPGLQAIAYREVFPLLRGTSSLASTREAIIHANWQYARRQLTWLRKEPRLQIVASRDEAVILATRWHDTKKERRSA